MELNSESQWVYLIGSAFAFVSSGIFLRLIFLFLNDWLHKRKGFVYKLIVFVLFALIFCAAFLSIMVCLSIIRDVPNVSNEQYFFAFSVGCVTMLIGYWLLKRVEELVSKIR